MQIEYQVNYPLTVSEFTSILQTSGLAQRRPVNDSACMADMLTHANLTITAWHGEQLIGVARALTDFSYVCYLSDLAVDGAYHSQGIGTQLQIQLRAELKPSCKLVLLAAPDAHAYYAKIGFTQHNRCWMLTGESELAPYNKSIS
jgi:GNAT superfamily N-acetyltransferase